MPSPQEFGLTKAAYSVQEALDVLSIGRTTAYSLVKEGKLKATRLGSKTLFLAVDLADFLTSLQSGEA